MNDVTERGEGEKKDTTASVEAVTEDSHSADEKPFLIVGLGASAGGLEAYKRFFARMPSASGMAFILVQHLSPEHKSMLGDLIARSTEMPVTAAEDGMPVEPDHLYLIPPDTVMTIERGRLRLRKPRQRRGMRTPIDTFFRSLAEDKGEDAVAVILSGTGTDGTLGIKAIKEHGGLTMAQASDSAKYNGMPKSAEATGLVDYMLAVEDMPDALIRYRDHLARFGDVDEVLREDSGPDSLGDICAILREQVGHDFSEYKENTLLRRVRRRMQVMQVDQIEDYLERLRTDSDEIRALAKDMLIGVTRFFRDPDAFEALEKQVISGIVDGRDASETIRVWVAGCATGEEAYSIAILLSEAMRRSKCSAGVQIFASDIDTEALAEARAGFYPKSALEEMSDERRNRYFVEEEDGFRTIKEIRDMCIFSEHNLISKPPFSRLDLISCRNLLIYLRQDLQKRLIPLFHYALRDHGYLFLGASENVTRHSKLFATVDKNHRIFRRREGPGRSNVSFPIATGESSAKSGRRSRPGRGEGGEAGANLQHTSERLILEKFTPPFVLVDEALDIVRFSDRMGDFLGPAAGTASLNLISMAIPELRLDLRAALHKATSSGNRVRHANVALTLEGTRRLFDIHVEPVETREGDSAYYLVVFDERHSVPPASDPAPSRGENRDEVVEQLERELSDTRERLKSTVEQLETSNEELKSSNEELLSMNEELQSGNEELETSQEELQSLNEELETINAELREKVDEADRANSDLNNLFEGTSVATLFLDTGLCIKKFTPAISSVFNLKKGDEGRSIGDFSAQIDYDDLEEDVAEVLRTLTPKEREIFAPDGSACFIVRIQPYRTIDNVIDGAVVNFLDVTHAKEQENRINELAASLRERVAELETLFEVVPTGLAIAEDPRCETIRLNKRAAEILGTDQESRPVGHPEAAYTAYRDGKELTGEDMPLQLAIRTGRSETDFECTIVVDETGQKREIIASAMPLFDSEGEARGAVSAFEDVTRIKRAMRRAEVHAARQECVAMIGSQALSAGEFAPVIEGLANSLRRMLHADLVEVLAFERDRGTLRVEAFSGDRIEKDHLAADSTSPAGAALAESHPVVADLRDGNGYPGARRYREAGFKTSVAAAVQLGEEQLGVLAAHFKEPFQADEDSLSFLRSLANLLGVSWDRKRASDRQLMLVYELQHRVKNILGVVSALANQTLDVVDNPRDFLTVFSGRIDALSRAHSLLSKTEWRGASVGDLLRAQVGPFAPAADRLDLDGPDVEVSSRAAVTLGLALHEMAVNGSKYGAWSSSAGKVSVCWRSHREKDRVELALEWIESGGPKVEVPDRKGFGSELIEEAIPYELDGTAKCEFRPTGFYCLIELPLD